MAAGAWVVMKWKAETVLRSLWRPCCAPATSDVLRGRLRDQCRMLARAVRFGADSVHSSAQKALVHAILGPARTQTYKGCKMVTFGVTSIRQSTPS